MTPSELKDLIDRYLKNNVTDEERKLVDNWYQSYEDSDQSISADKEIQLSEDIYGYVQERLHPAPAKIRRITINRRYAAAAAAILLVSATLFSRKKAPERQAPEAFTTVSTSTGQVKQLDLPDGSKIWLNAQTSIRVSKSFERHTNRNIYLDEGEAFFEVSKNPARPFLVITKSITTRVLGTSFNVKAYKQLHSATVTVRTGRVQVSDKQKQLAVLLPNQKITYLLKEHTSYVSTYNAESSRTWAEGKTVLNRVSFNEVALAMYNIYGVKLTSKNKLTRTYQYNITISPLRNVDETIRVICSIHQNSFRRKNDEVIIY
ncbi:FecR family protein [Mucilaginibacter phyllosphaerae]